VDTSPVPHGPRKVTSKNQISIPEELLRSVGVTVGHNVFLMINPDKPGTLVLFPQALLARVIEKGWTGL